MGIRTRLDRIETLLQAVNGKVPPDEVYQTIDGNGWDTPEEWAAKIAEREAALVEKYGTAEGVLFICLRQRFGPKPALDKGLQEPNHG